MEIDEAGETGCGHTLKYPEALGFILRALCGDMERFQNGHSAYRVESGWEQEGGRGGRNGTGSPLCLFQSLRSEVMMA